MIDVRDLADDLSNAIVEYQVSAGIENRTLDDPFIRLAVLPAEGDLRQKLYTDCKS
jgi:hypothetical protein